MEKSLLCKPTSSKTCVIRGGDGESGELWFKPGAITECFLHHGSNSFGAPYDEIMMT